MSQDSNHHLLDDEGAGYLISISDMMSGLLFIFIITLVAFVINFQDAIQQQEEKRQKYEKISADLQEKNLKLEEEILRNQKTRAAYTATVQEIIGSEAIRENLLLQIQKRLLTQGIQIQIDAHHGVLRLTEKAIRFDTGAAELDDDQLSKLEIIGETLAVILPCYAANPPAVWIKDGTCNLKTQGKLDSVFVEGHTDNVPVNSTKWGRYQNNWELSALRAIYTYQKLIPTRPHLVGMFNLNDQPIFSVSGYGEGRPIPGHSYEVPTPDLDNRRIDLRFIMTPPSETEAEKSLKAAGVN